MKAVLKRKKMEHVFGQSGRIKNFKMKSWQNKNEIDLTLHVILPLHLTAYLPDSSLTKFVTVI